MGKGVGPGNRRDWRCKLCDKSGGGGKGPNRASQKAIAIHVAKTYGQSDWHDAHKNWKRSHGLPVEPRDGREETESIRLIMERYIDEIAERNTETLPPKVKRLTQYIRDQSRLSLVLGEELTNRCLMRRIIAKPL